MFGPSSCQGRERVKSTLLVPFAKVMPEDGFEAMGFLCPVALCKNDSVSKKVPLSTVLKLVVLCDEYECTNVMRLLARLWAVSFRMTSGIKKAQRTWPIGALDHAATSTLDDLLSPLEH